MWTDQRILGEIHSLFFISTKTFQVFVSLTAMCYDQVNGSCNGIPFKALIIFCIISASLLSLEFVLNFKRKWEENSLWIKRPYWPMIQIKLNNPSSLRWCWSSFLFFTITVIVVVCINFSHSRKIKQKQFLYIFLFFGSNKERHENRQRRTSSFVCFRVHSIDTYIHR